jgi:ubiquinone/menaquinone biosynthesis C-methylase UbiE
MINKATDTSSNEMWKNWNNYIPFERRAYRFTDDMLPLFYKWLGIGKDSCILDAGCGTGVFGRYLAAGLECGHVIGFDINQLFIEYGRKKLVELGLADKVMLQVDDGFALSFPSNTFDAVTNYTYIGVLSDPIAGMMELIRVCKPGGIVSCVVAANSFPPVSWQGDYPFDGADELQKLTRIESEIFSKYARKAADLKQSEKWHAQRYPKMFDVCGLKEISVYPYAFALNYNDIKLPLEYRQDLLLGEIEDELNWLDSRYIEKRDIYIEHGFFDQQFNRLKELLHIKYNYVKNNFANDRSFEWCGGFNFIVAGRKV